MNTETQPNESQEAGNIKVMTGFRCHSELKQRLIEEANALGIYLSEHIENQLLSVYILKSENAHKDEIITELTKQISSLQEQLNVARGNTDLVVVEKKKVVAKNDELNQKIMQMNQLLAVYNEPRLHELYEQLKGRHDFLQTQDGDIHHFSYDEPIHVLYAMIHSFQLRKP